jgi:hypothetical protein
MSKKINYNQKPVILYYSNNSLAKANLENCCKLKATGKGEGKNYYRVEQEAQLYLIRDAMLKKPTLNLKKIVGIKQEIDYDYEKEGLVKITLRGIALFK